MLGEAMSLSWRTAKASLLSAPEALFIPETADKNADDG
jgi:hypothetical protein